MARAIFKGRILLGDVTVPVKLYAAVSDRRVHFRLLHEEDQVPVVQHMVHPGTSEQVASEDIRSGYETDDGRLVVLEDDELDALAPKPSRDLEILRFVSPDVMGTSLYLRPYYLGPDGPAGDYFALIRALEEETSVGVVRWVMRKRTYHGALQVVDGHLVLFRMRSPDEVISAKSLEAPGGKPLSAQEAKMAEQLVEMLAGELDMSAFKNDYAERVAELVAAKAAGKTPRLPKVKEKAETDDLLNALKASIGGKGVKSVGVKSVRGKKERKVA